MDVIEHMSATSDTVLNGHQGIASQDIGQQQYGLLKLLLLAVVSIRIRKWYSKRTLRVNTPRTSKTADTPLDNDQIPTYSKNITIFRDNWFLFWYRTLPLNAVSRLWGRFNKLTVPKWFRPYGYRFYCFLYNVDVDEILDKDFASYPNLASFFYRRIDGRTRPIAAGDNVVASPSDGTILQFGVIDSDTGAIEQVKGLTYSIREFLGTHEDPLMSKSKSCFDLTQYKNDPDHEEPFKHFYNEGDKSLLKYTSSHTKITSLLNELSEMNIPVYNNLSDTTTLAPRKHSQLYFVVIYLSPGDYHHFHSPVNWLCKLRRHFPGHLFSVSPYFQRNFPNLFVLNERVPLLGYWKHGFFSMTAVGATNVGSIKLNFDKELVTNVKANSRLPRTCYEAIYNNTNQDLGGVPLLKGEEMGGFEFGSTVVLCFEAPIDFQYDITIGQKIKLGEKIGTA